MDARTLAGILAAEIAARERMQRMADEARAHALYWTRQQRDAENFAARFGGYVVIPEKKVLQ